MKLKDHTQSTPITRSGPVSQRGLWTSRQGFLKALHPQGTHSIDSGPEVPYLCWAS